MIRLLAVLIFLGHRAWAGEDLYALQARPYQPFARTKLWNWNGSGPVIMRQRIVPNGTVLGTVRYDDEARIVAFAFSGNETSSVENLKWIRTIKMNAPQELSTILIGSAIRLKGDRLVFWDGLFDLPDRGLFYPFSVTNNEEVIGNYGIDLKYLNPAIQVLDTCSVSYYRRSGGPNLTSFEVVIAQMRFNKEGRPVFAGGWEDCKPLFAFPPAFSEGFAENPYLFVHASTPKLFVVTRGNDLGKDATGATTTTLWVRLHATGEWRTVTVPGSYPAVRAFGQRLAIAVRSAVENRSPDIYGEFSNYSQYRLYEESQLEYPGTLLIHDAGDGRQWKIETHHTDSEILLIRGDELYYRIHTKLLRARLEPGGVVKTEQVIDDRPEIAEMHWAFFGPAWPSSPLAAPKVKAKAAPEPKIVTEMPPGVYYRIGGGVLPKPGVKGLPEPILRHGLQTWYLKSQRMPGYTEYYIGPLDDDDLVEELDPEFRKVEIRMAKEVFPKPR